MGLSSIAATAHFLYIDVMMRYSTLSKSTTPVA